MILIIDLSYFVFYRFYASKAYVKISKQGDSITCDFDDDAFKTMYTSGIVKSLEKLAKKFRPSVVYLSKDCMRNDIWRNDIYDNYKNRKNLSDFDGRAFDIAIREVVPDIQRRFRRFKVNRTTELDIPIEIVSCDKCEADDVSYVLCKKVFRDEKKIVITGDHDYMQLIDENTDVMDLKLKSLKDKSLGSASEDLMFKILIGDKSDNIPQICSKKHALEIVRKHSYEEIVEMYESDAKFTRNRTLVDMNEIPATLVAEIVESFERRRVESNGASRRASPDESEKKTSV